MGRKKSPSTIYELLQEAASRVSELMTEYEESFTSEYFQKRVKNIHRNFDDDVKFLGRLLDHLEVAKKEVILVRQEQVSGDEAVYIVERLHEAKREKFIDAILSMDLERKDEADVHIRTGA